MPRMLLPLMPPPCATTIVLGAAGNAPPMPYVFCEFSLKATELTSMDPRSWEFWLNTRFVPTLKDAEMAE